MSCSPRSSSRDATRPRRLTWRYQSSASSTVSATRGSRRMNRSLSLAWSMLSKTRSPSQSYQVATVWGEPFRRSDATTAGLGRRRNSSTSAGTGADGIGWGRAENTFPAVSILGVDVGGTFTDAVLVTGESLRTAKVPTAPRQEESLLAAARAVGAEEVERFRHGTTVATNALLERKGARTAFVATDGFEHLLHLRRQNRAHLYRLCASHAEPVVPLEHCFGVRERVGPEGVLVPLELGSLPELGDEVEAVAVCLLFSFRDASHERA